MLFATIIISKTVVEAAGYANQHGLRYQAPILLENYWNNDSINLYQQQSCINQSHVFITRRLHATLLLQTQT